MAAPLLTLLAVLLAGASDAGVAPPTDRDPPDLARVYFRMGDVARAITVVRSCAKTHPKQCKKLKMALVEYQALATRFSPLTQSDVKALLAWDAQISPGEPSRMTKPVLERWVVVPLREAGLANAASNPRRALELVEAVLDEQPGNAEAQAMLQQLSPDGGTRAKPLPILEQRHQR
ncbi:MAG: hypothetical protein K1X64_06350 [Myxococcaceae bacterium]|nr:hypothetical protein [Myxococcaceae bacterium]